MIIEKIKRTTEEKTQRFLFYGFAVLLFLLPVPQLMYPVHEKAIAMQASIIMFAAIYFGFFIIVEILNKRASIRTYGITWKCVIGLTIIGIISVLFSEYRMVSLYGTRIRTEGLFSLVSYYVFFMAATMMQNKKYRRSLLYLFLGLGCIVAVLGVIQFTGVIELSPYYSGMAYIPMRNPNFYASFAIMFTGVAMGGYSVYSSKSAVVHPWCWWTRLTWFVLVLFGYASCISASSSVSYVGLIMMLLLYLYFEIISGHRDFWSFLWLVLSLIGMMVFLNILSSGSVFSEFTSVGVQIAEEGSLFGDRVGTGRMQIWKQTISLLPRFWLFGCGIELLILHCFEGYLGTNCVAFDRAHNEYLNLWITEGIFALVIYLVFLFALFLPGIAMFMKNKKTGEVRHVGDEVSKIALFAFFGYIAQAFFNISVVQVAPYFWMICGLLYSRKRNVNEEAMDR